MLWSCERNGSGKGPRCRLIRHVSHHSFRRKMKDGNISKRKIVVAALVTTIGSTSDYRPSRFSSTTLKAQAMMPTWKFIIALYHMKAERMTEQRSSMS